MALSRELKLKIAAKAVQTSLPIQDQLSLHNVEIYTQRRYKCRAHQNGNGLSVVFNEVQYAIIPFTLDGTPNLWMVAVIQNELNVYQSKAIPIGALILSEKEQDELFSNQSGEEGIEMNEKSKKNLTKEEKLEVAKKLAGSALKSMSLKEWEELQRISDREDWD